MILETLVLVIGRRLGALWAQVDHPPPTPDDEEVEADASFD